MCGEWWMRGWAEAPVDLFGISSAWALVPAERIRPMSGPRCSAAAGEKTAEMSATVATTKMPGPCASVSLVVLTKPERATQKSWSGESG